MKSNMLGSTMPGNKLFLANPTLIAEEAVVHQVLVNPKVTSPQKAVGTGVTQKWKQAIVFCVVVTSKQGIFLENSRAIGALEFVGSHS